MSYVGSTYSSDPVIRIIAVPVVDLISLPKEQKSGILVLVQYFGNGAVCKDNRLAVAIVIFARLHARRCECKDMEQKDEEYVRHHFEPHLRMFVFTARG